MSEPRRRTTFLGLFSGLSFVLLVALYGSAGSSPAVATVKSLPTPEAAATPAKMVTLRLSVAGDILLARSVGGIIARSGWETPFLGAADLVAGADIAFANLECPAAFTGSPYPGKMSAVTFRSDPGALFGLKSAGFDVLSLANNHSNDYGGAALEETLAALKLLGIATCGAGATARDAHEPAILRVGGLRVAFLAYAEPLWSVVAARPDKPGVAVIDPARIQADIRHSRAVADLVIVSLHWGEEHQGYPRERDRQLAYSLVDAGADALIGHHPHVLQGAEFYRGVPILYSMGNFVFDMQAATTYQSAVATIDFEVTLSPKRERVSVSSLSYVPVQIDRHSYAPARAAGKVATAIQTLIQNRCALLGTPGYGTPDGVYRLRP